MFLGRSLAVPWFCLGVWNPSRILLNTCPEYSLESFLARSWPAFWNPTCLKLFCLPAHAPGLIYVNTTCTCASAYMFMCVCLCAHTPAIPARESTGRQAATKIVLPISSQPENPQPCFWTQTVEWRRQYSYREHPRQEPR